MKNIKYFLLSLMIMSVLSISCKKEDKTVSGQDNNKLAAVIADNFNLSIFNTGLVRTGLKVKLQEPGPFTVIAPSDDAFHKAGFADPVAILSADPARISAIMSYHVINGNYELNKLPFLFNQEIRSANGGKLFVTHWVKGPDTILTVNGSRVLAQNIKASNGLIQVLNQVLEPYSHEMILDAMASDRNLSLFYQAIQRAGLTVLLNGKGPYTIFAADNNAMIQYGLSSLEEINQADPVKLAALLKYHVLSDRRFVYDYILSTGTSGKSEQAMIDGNSIQVQLVPDPSVPGNFSGIQLKGTGNTGMILLTKKDVLTGNGVLHTINSVLKITQ